MDRLEMARKLFENPKLKAINSFGVKVHVKKVIEEDAEWFDLVWTMRDFTMDMIINRDETWEIIEPKLKEFCFGEIIYLCKKGGIYTGNIKSVETGSSYLKRDLILEEYKGKWTIEGYYEEVDNA